MPYRANYPATVAEILDARLTFRPDALRALRAFRRSKPWRGTVAERFAKFQTLNAALAAAYGIDPPRLGLGTTRTGTSGESHYRPRDHRIVLSGRLSVVTYLHEFA